jgi:hypothetical protein
MTVSTHEPRTWASRKSVVLTCFRDILAAR